MRVGFVTTFDCARIDFARHVGLGSVELLLNAAGDYLPPRDGWAARADEVVGRWRAAGIRVSCLGGFYVNTLDPARDEEHRGLVRSTIELAARLEVPVVAGFAGRIVGAPLEESIAPFARVWREHAAFAGDRGVWIAFEPCPMGWFHTPEGGMNCLCTPWMWERAFDAAGSDLLGLEWDASHLVCMGIDPVRNLRRWGGRVLHVHAKDARVSHWITTEYGPYHPDAAEHCVPGTGDADWAGIVRELLRHGYQGDLNIEGWHDRAYCDDAAAGIRREDMGILLAHRHLSALVDGT